MTTVVSNAGGIVPGSAGLHVRPLFDPFRPSQRRLQQPAPTETSPLAPRDSVWEALSLVLHQQLGHDAMLLWRYDRRREQLHLAGAAPIGPWASDLIIKPSEHLIQLGNQRLEAVAHVHCALAECPLEQTLWELGLHSGLTAVLSEGESEAFLITFGFRQRWQLVAHHATPIVAVMKYLQECRRLALPRMARRWWELPAQVPHLWRQPYRPSALRTMHDLNETLADVAERVRDEQASHPVQLPTRISRLAHKAADLMGRLESVYLDSRPTIGSEELLGEAVLLVRGAYDLCVEDWPGCLGTSKASPHTGQTDHQAVRHALVDFVLRQLEAEATAA